MYGYGRRGGGRGGYGGPGGGIVQKHDGEYWTDCEAEPFRKIFIGGLSYETTNESLKQHFEQWGTVEDCVVMKDPVTKRSRGFGFITYEKASSVDKAQAKRPHNIDGRDVETKRAMPRDRSEEPGGQNVTKKIHVKNLRRDTTEDEIRQLFSAEGEVENVVIPTKNNLKSSFCFVTFKDTDTTDKCVIKKMFDLNGTQLEVNKAIERNQMYQEMGGRGGGGGGGMRGGRGRGGYQNYDNYSYGQYDDYGQGGYGGYGPEYNGGYGGGPGAMKSGGYSQRGQGPYDGGYGGGGGGGGYGGYGGGRGGGRY